MSKGRHVNTTDSVAKIGLPGVQAEQGAPLPSIAKLQADMRNNLLSDIEDYCILFGTAALPALQDYLEQATTGWTKRPDPGLVEGAHDSDDQTEHLQRLA